MPLATELPFVTAPHRFALALLVVSLFITRPLTAQHSDTSLRFLPNMGQVVDVRARPCPEVLYTTEGPGMKGFVRRNGLSIVLYRIDGVVDQDAERINDPIDWLSDTALLARRIGDPSTIDVKGHRIDLEFVDALPDFRVEELDRATDYVNIYQGDVAPIEYLGLYGRLILHNVWKGIDIVLRGNGSGLKYDFIVHPGANPADIHLRYSGSDGLEMDSSGGIAVATSLGLLRDRAPVVYQRGDTIWSRFVVTGNDVRFDVGDFDSHQDLVVDPTLVWSTFYGGTAADYAGFYSTGTQYVGNSLTIDTAGNIYTCGKTYSIDFPVSPGAFQTIPGQSPLNEDAWVVSFSKSGVRRWATYIGGVGAETASGIDVNAGNVLVFQGTTTSANFPVTATAFQPIRGSLYDAFVIRLSTLGARIWSTYLGGSGNDYGGYVAVDRNGSIMLSGTTLSSNFPISTGAYRSVASGQETYLMRFDAAGNRRWGTFVGATNVEEPGGLDIDTSGTIGVALKTTSTDFPTTSGTHRQTWTRTGSTDYEAVVAAFDSSGNYLWGTYFGGNANDVPRGLAFDGTGHLYLGGGTQSTNLPTTAASLQPAMSALPNLYQDAFVARFSPQGALRWCTYYGAGSQDYTSGVSAEWNGHVYLAGTACSGGVIRSGVSYQATYAGGCDGFLLELDSLGRIVWDTYIGGSQIDYALAIVGDGLGSLFVAGYTTGLGFPIVNAWQSTFAGGYDAFICRFCNSLYPPMEVDGPVSFCDGDSVHLSGPPGFDQYVWWPTNDTTRLITVRTSGRYTVTIIETTGCLGHSDTVAVVVHALPAPVIQVLGDTTICDGDSVTLRAQSPGARGYRWSTGSTADRIIVKRTGTYSVEITDSNGCHGLTPAKTIIVRPRPVPARITPSDTVRVCPDSLATISVGSGYYIVAWNNGAATATQRVGPGRYWARVSNNVDCWNGSDTVTVVEYPRPVAKIEALGPRVFCRGDSVLLDGGPGFVRYTWNTGDTGRFHWARGAGSFRVTVVDSNGCIAVSDPIGTTEYAVPNPNIAPPNTILCEGDSLVLDASSVEFEHYRWSTGDTTPRIVVRKSGQYGVIVTSIFGCEGSSSIVDIGVFPRPFVDIAGPSEICTGSRATYSTNSRPGLRYEWSWTGDGTLVGGIAGSSATIAWGAPGTGTVTVRVTDPLTGCDSTASIPVIIGTGLVPRITADRRIVCPGDSVEIDAGADYTEYLWSTGQRSRTIWGHPGMVYTVHVKNAEGCSGTSLPISISASTPPAPTVIARGPRDICEGDSVVLDAGPGFASYRWSDGSTGQILVVRSTGDYSVRVTDTLGCEGVSDAVPVAVHAIPAPVVTGPDQVCRNSTATYATTANGGATYQWTVTGGTILSGQGTAEIVVSWGGAGGGSVSVIEDSPAGCTGGSPQLDVIIGTQLRPVITPGGILAICTGDSILLDAGSGFASYLWSTGDTTRRLIIRSGGTFSVVVTDTSGCSGRSSDVVVNEFLLPTPVIRSLGPTTVNEGDSVVLEVDTTFAAYLWTSGERTRQIVVKASGVYGVNIVDSNGCRGTSAPVRVTVIPKVPPPDTADVHLWLGDITGYPGELISVPIHMRETNLATSGATRVSGKLRFNRTLLAPMGRTSVGWIEGRTRVIPFDVWLSDVTPGGDLTQLEFLPVLGDAESTVMAVDSVRFTGGVVRVTTDSGTFSLNGLCREGGTRLLNTDGEFGIKIVRPNPAGNLVEIEYELIEDGPMRLELYDLLGRKVLQLMRREAERGRYGAVADLREVADGWYMLVLISGTERALSRIHIAR